jgi:hypothetical protein
MPGAELICVALGGLIPCLLAYGVIRTPLRRAVFAFVVLLAGMAFTALSAALSYGPEHAWAWLDETVRVALLGAALLAILSLPVSCRAATALALLALAFHLSLLNQAPADPYFEQTRQIWEQGRFIRFNGLAQWLGWLWPFAALLYALLRLSSRDGLSPEGRLLAEAVKSPDDFRQPAR